MKTKTLLIITSMLSILLSTFHLAHDMVYGWEPGTWRNLWALPIFVAWLYGTLVLRERLAGYIIMLIGGLLALGLPVIHMSGKGIGVASRVASSNGHFFFVWTLIMLGVLGSFSLVLAVRGIAAREWGQTD
jgi:hypothetical protein